MLYLPAMSGFGTGAALLLWSWPLAAGDDEELPVLLSFDALFVLLFEEVFA
jgi:hypothetical protein